MYKSNRILSKPAALFSLTLALLALALLAGLLLTPMAVRAQTATATLAPLPENATWPEIELELISDQFQYPVFALAPPDASGRFFLVERAGQILIHDGAGWLDTPFLDIRAQVNSNQECGMLSMAFPPDFGPANPVFYVYYSANTNLLTPPPATNEPDSGCDTVIARFRVSDDPNIANAASEERILVINQPYTNHNGGQIAFGPDGALYVGMGDGGSGGDPFNAGQRGDTLLGKMLRVTVDEQPNYRIPQDNPFVNSADFRPEIWATGLRNPYRFSFDRTTGDLYIGDVGQDQWEEINFQPAASTGGENYGWRVVEGTDCYGAGACAIENYTAPVFAYPHSDEGCGGAVTGGYVYRGPAAALQGIYLYGDYCDRTLRGLQRVANPAASTAGVSNVQPSAAQQSWAHTIFQETPVRITSFGEDAGGNLYLMGLEGNGAARRGVLYRIGVVEDTPAAAPQVFMPQMAAAAP
ncbi:MAG: PQQ-dependent sugar dehydrogenase [Litorilinea sp.]